VGVGPSRGGRISLFDQIFGRGLIKRNVFSVFYYPPSRDKYLVLGAVEEEYCEGWTFYYATDRFSWVVPMNRVDFMGRSYGGQKLLLDFTDLYINVPTFVLQALIKDYGLKLEDPKCFYENRECYSISCNASMSLAFTLGDRVLSFEKFELMRDDPIEGSDRCLTYFNTFSSNTAPYKNFVQWSIGTLFVRKQCLAFDSTNHQVGIGDIKP
jgi:hypothetical protein